VGRDYRDKKQVKAVLNYVASADWVVALFPRALETFPIQDLGSAGHDGFEQAHPGRPVRWYHELGNLLGITASHTTQKPPSLHELARVRGHHNAALDEHNWRAIATFVVEGTEPKIPNETPCRSLAEPRVLRPYLVARVASLDLDRCVIGRSDLARNAA